MTAEDPMKVVAIGTGQFVEFMEWTEKNTDEINGNDQRICRTHCVSQ